jgi:ribosomal protein S27AE
MPEMSWQYQNSKIPLDQLVNSIYNWVQSGGYVGKVKSKPDESTLVINKGPGTWKGKVKLKVSGSQNVFTVHLDMGKAPFESMAQALPGIIEHYSGAISYQPPPTPPVPAATPPAAPAAAPPPPQAEPEPQAAPPAPVAEPQKPRCPICGNEATFVDQYNRWYCYTDRQYLPEPVEEPAIQPQVVEVAPEPEVVPEPEPIAEPEPEPEPIVETKEHPCPTCDNEANFIEQYDRWYCYTCQKYLPEPVVEPEPSPIPEPVVETKEHPCPTCDNEASFIEQYDRYYCHTCQKYLPEPVVEPEPSPVPEPEPVVETKEHPCPTCDNEASFIEQYDRYYCHTCQKYLPEPVAEPEVPPAPEPEPKAMICPTCGNEGTFVEQYNRWYCYKDKKYL